jgi:hypothetical protein
MSAPWDMPLRINWRCPGMDLLRALGDEQSALGLTRATLLSTLRSQLPDQRIAHPFYGLGWINLAMLGNEGFQAESGAQRTDQDLASARMGEDFASGIVCMLAVIVRRGTFRRCQRRDHRAQLTRRISLLAGVS